MKLRVFVVAAVIVSCTVAVKLSTTDQHAVVASGDPNFGIVVINQASAAHTFTIGPEGDAIQENVVVAIFTCTNFPLVSVGGVDAGGTSATGLSAPVFRRCVGDIGVGTAAGTGSGTGSRCQDSEEIGTFDFAVQFTPTVTGPQSCAITVHTELGEQHSFLVGGIGKLPDHAVVFDQRVTTMAFSQVRLSELSVVKTIDVVNAGGMNLTTNAAQTGDPEFVVTGGLGTQVLTPGGKKTFTVLCDPSILGPLAGNLTITTDADNPADRTLSISLSCEAIPDNSISFEANKALSLVARVGEMDSIGFTLLNDAGIGNAIIQSVTLLTGHPDLELTQPASLSLGVGASTTFSVIYRPTASFDGIIDTVVVNIAGQPQRTAVLQAKGTVATPRAEPPDIDFGPICVGQSMPGTITILAGADGEFNVSSFAPSGPPNIPFNVSGVPGLVKPMPDRSDVVISIVAGPPETGEFDQQLVVVTDAPGATSFEVPVKTVGLAPGVTASPDIVVFSSTELDTITNPKKTFFTNCTDEVVRLDGVRLEGNVADFVIGDVRPQDPPFDLDPSGRIEIDVQLQPGTVGLKTAQLVIAYDGDSERIVELTGEGIDSTLDRDSYYRCSSGRATSAWPILAVVWFAVRRRRRS